MILLIGHVDGRTHAAARMFENVCLAGVRRLYGSRRLPINRPLRVPCSAADGVARRRCEERGTLPKSCADSECRSLIILLTNEVMISIN